ncbi:O-antigen ligase family protein [Agrobacterium tumefaciens]|nr:O-antigen ligase family protein [Agrobacterium tumefaciens]NTE21963.1 O-antigen ligase family protein [Agrobacterium tumefaciens]
MSDLKSISAKPSLEANLFKGFLIFLPFSQALTINLFFPLKISEIFLILILFLKLISLKNVNERISKLSGILILFCLIIFISLIINGLTSYSYPLNLLASRLSPLLDGILKIIYILLVVFAMFISIDLLKKKPDLIKYLFTGAIIASSYAWYLFFSGLLKIPVLLLPGMEEDPQSFMGIVRCATFKEGNYMGFYLLLMGIVALHHGKKKLSVFLFLSIITTFSTASITCLFLFLILYFYNVYRKHIVKLLMALLFICSTVILLMLFSPVFQTMVYNKIFANEENADTIDDVYSRLDRINTTRVGFEMFWDNPIFGVGPSSYGLHYAHYNKLPDFDFAGKRIPNNIYIEVLCELGIIAMILFLYFLWQLVVFAYKKSPILLSGLLVSYLYFFAFPTFTMLFIWIFFSVVISSKFTPKLPSVNKSLT